MALRLKLRREQFERNRAAFAERADVDYEDVYALEERGVGSARTVRKCFAAIESYQRRALSPSEKEDLLSEPYDPQASLKDRERAEEERPMREATKALAREALVQKAREQGLDYK